MNLIRRVGINLVIAEWLKAEWYKDHFDTVRDQHTSIIENPNLNSVKENAIRRKLIMMIRGDMVQKILNLPFEWYIAKFKSYNQFSSLNIITAADWYLVTNKSFSLSQTWGNLHHNKIHEDDVKKKKHQLKEKGEFAARLILVGESTQNLTIIEGNHRACAYLHHNNEHGSQSFPDEVIVGLSPLIGKFQWSSDWTKLPMFLQKCETELLGNK